MLAPAEPLLAPWQQPSMHKGVLLGMLNVGHAEGNLDPGKLGGRNGDEEDRVARSMGKGRRDRQEVGHPGLSVGGTGAERWQLQYRACEGSGLCQEDLPETLEKGGEGGEGVLWWRRGTAVFGANDQTRCDVESLSSRFPCGHYLNG